jgi:hypothetical protein
MGDAGEGLVDAEARIQERAEEVERERRERQRAMPPDPAAVQQRESLELARTELQRQLDVTTDERRRSSLKQAIEEVDRRIVATGTELGIRR